MNIDEIKDSWNQEEPQKKLELENIDLHKRAKSPIDKIKRNLLYESIAYLLAAFLFISVVITSDYLPKTEIVAFVTTFIGIINIVLFLVYVIRLIYKIQKQDMSKSSSLNDVIFQLKLSIETYRSYNYTMMPIALLLGMSLQSHNMFDHIYNAYTDGNLSSPEIIIGGTVFTVLLFFSYWFTNYWINKVYGHHLAELDSIRDDLS